jgi:hypothetical protein
MTYSLMDKPGYIITEVHSFQLAFNLEVAYVICLNFIQTKRGREPLLRKARVTVFTYNFKEK